MLALSVADIDFLDPELRDETDARERGVRLELRLVDTDHSGSIYASPRVSLAPALCRIDLLESAPGAGDRIHWHPTMIEGEPGDRAFDTTLSKDPVEWLSHQLDDLTKMLHNAGQNDLDRFDLDVSYFAARKEQILRRVNEGLVAARQNWDAAVHDERGLTPIR